MTQQRWEKYSIYAMVLLSMFFMCVPIVYVARYIGAVFQDSDNKILVEAGYINTSSYNYQELKPLGLKGEWNVYAGLYLDDAYVEIPEGYVAQLEMFPILNLMDAAKEQTYQVFIAMDGVEDLLLSIPLESPQVRVYFNGHTLEQRKISTKWLSIPSEYTLHEIMPYYDASKEYQEILISVPSEIKMTNLFDRNITVSVEDNYIAQERVLHSLQFFLIGAMIMIIVVGFSYMILVPSFSTLTIMNLFDSALMFHILFNMSTIPQVIVSSLQIESHGGIIFRRLDIFFLLLACFIGPTLAKSLFDPENKVNKYFDKPVLYMLAVVMVVFFIFPQLVNTYASILLIILLTYGVIGILLRYKITIEDGKATRYKQFHLLKTIYIGIVIFLDMATLSSALRDNTLLFFLYTIFFVVHIVIKAYEYRLLFVSIENMNKELEVTVEERTKELMIANQELKEISFKDPLTGAYNRLYFDEQFENYLSLCECGNINSLHLCMFDLDKFKSINDTFGHVVGDEQLKEAVTIAKRFTREHIQLARIGGEEFTLLFINREDEEVLDTCESLRFALEELSKEKEGRTTGSFGIYKPLKYCENRLIFANADKCLYYSKEHGRNRITYDFGEGIKIY